MPSGISNTKHKTRKTKHFQKPMHRIWGWDLSFRWICQYQGFLVSTERGSIWRGHSPGHPRFSRIVGCKDEIWPLPKKSCGHTRSWLKVGQLPLQPLVSLHLLFCFPEALSEYLQVSRIKQLMIQSSLALPLRVLWEEELQRDPRKHYYRVSLCTQGTWKAFRWVLSIWFNNTLTLPPKITWGGFKNT